jgi:hypothetical protein
MSFLYLFYSADHTRRCLEMSRVVNNIPILSLNWTPALPPKLTYVLRNILLNTASKLALASLHLTAINPDNRTGNASSNPLSTSQAKATMAKTPASQNPTPYPEIEDAGRSELIHRIAKCAPGVAMDSAFWAFC